jgi:hypothetical protein
MDKNDIVILEELPEGRRVLKPYAEAAFENRGKWIQVHYPENGDGSIARNLKTHYGLEAHCRKGFVYCRYNPDK